MAKIVRIFPKPPPNPAVDTITRGSNCNGISSAPRRRTEHIYSTIEDAERDPLNLDLDLPVLGGGVGTGTGVYSEPEHFYTCIDDLSEKSKLGEKVSVEVEKDSDISEEEGNNEGKKPELKPKPENGKHEFQMRQLAKALYDNAAESGDEIDFRRGDVLTVLERDTGGLVGWALVRHRGRTGIAPQNRLRLLGAVEGGEEGDGDGGGGGKVQWNRRSWAVEPDKVLTPRKVGDVYIYDQSNQDYDVPPSRYFPEAATKPPSSAATKATPPRLQAPPSSDIYDSPRSLALKHSGGYCPSDYDTPISSNAASQRSSTVSMLSTGSGTSRITPNSSARSSSEFRDIYDVPPAAKPVNSRTLLPDTRKLDMALESLETYDIPRNLKEYNNQSFDAPGMEIYDTPPALKPSTSYDDYDYAQIAEDSSSRISSDSGVETGKMEALQISEDVYDTPPSLGNKPSAVPALGPKKGSRCSLHALMPSTVHEDIYDVPPMVSRDQPPQPPPMSLLRNKSGRSGVKDVSSLDTRSSICSENSSSGSSDIPSVSYKELKVDLATALEQLNSAQDGVNKSAKRLLGFVSSTWRKRDTLEANLFDVKVSCIAVRTALQEFVEFSEGTVANSVKVQDKKLVKNLVKNLDPVQSYLKQVDQAMKGLEEKRWLLSKLVVDTPSAGQNDELGTIVNVARMIPEHCRTLHTIIQANAKLLFEGPIEELPSPKKTKPARPPPPTMPKPKPNAKRSTSVESAKSQNSPSQRHSIQERPLPTPPRPLPKPPSEASLSSGSETTPSRPSLSRHSSAVSSSSASRSSRSRSRSPPPPPAFRARSNSDYDNNWGNMADARDSGASDHNQGIVGNQGSGSGSGSQQQEDYVSLDETVPVEQESSSSGGIHFLARTEPQQRASTVDHMGYEMPRSSLTKPFSERLKRVQQSIDEPTNSLPKSRSMPNGQMQQIYDEPTNTEDVIVLDDNDRMLLGYYAAETVTLTQRLVAVIDAFFATMRGASGGVTGPENESPSSPPDPQVFVEHSKAVIVAGQRLVCVCDTVTRNLSSPDVRDKVLAVACHLCDCLKRTVAAAKQAGGATRASGANGANGAGHGDIVAALQHINDRLVDVTHAAREVKLVLTQAAAL